MGILCLIWQLSVTVNSEKALVTGAASWCISRIHGVAVGEQNAVCLVNRTSPGPAEISWERPGWNLELAKGSPLQLWQASWPDKQEQAAVVTLWQVTRCQLCSMLIQSCLLHWALGMWHPCQNLDSSHLWCPAHSQHSLLRGFQRDERWESLVGFLTEWQFPWQRTSPTAQLANTLQQKSKHLGPNTTQGS